MTMGDFVKCDSLDLAESAGSDRLHTASTEKRPPRHHGRGDRRCPLQISVCSEISRASSTSMPRYLTVDSSLECPSSNCTARRFLVRR